MKLHESVEEYDGLFMNAEFVSKLLFNLEAKVTSNKDFDIGRLRSEVGILRGELISLSAKLNKLKPKQ